jgi:hypothetical protein
MSASLHCDPETHEPATMRTLVDLHNTDHGYVRIYAEREGFGYEVSTYTPTPIADLFQRMSGFPSIDDASAAAVQQLSAAQQSRRTKARSHRRAR